MYYFSIQNGFLYCVALICIHIVILYYRYWYYTLSHPLCVPIPHTCHPHAVHQMPSDFASFPHHLTVSYVTYLAKLCSDFRYITRLLFKSCVWPIHLPWRPPYTDDVTLYATSPDFLLCSSHNYYSYLTIFVNMSNGSLHRQPIRPYFWGGKSESAMTQLVGICFFGI